MQLSKYNIACHALAEAKGIDDVKEIINKADAIKEYARRAKNRQMEIDAAEIRMRAERRYGELLAEMKQAGKLSEGGRPSLKPVPLEEPVNRTTLAELDTTKKFSSRCQKIAAIPAEEFEVIVDDWRNTLQEANERVTTNILAAADKAHNHRAQGTGENEWYTPTRYIEMARTVMGEINLDPASSEIAQKGVKAERYFTKDDNGLSRQWAQNTKWVNPTLCACGVQPKVIDWAHETKNMSDMRESVFREEDLCGVPSATNPIYKNVQSMLETIAKHARVFSGQIRNGKVVFRLLQGMRPGECAEEAGKAEGRPTDERSVVSGKATIPPKRQGQGTQTSQERSRQPSPTPEEDESLVFMDASALGALPAGVGLQVRVLWSGNDLGSGSLCTAITSRVSGDCSGEYGGLVLCVQCEKGGDSPEGLVGFGSVCPNCGKVGVSVTKPSKVFLNPPYTQPAIQQFIEKVVAEYNFGRVNQAIILTHNYTDTAWFQLLAKACDSICFTRGRIAFENPKGEKAAPTQGQAFFYIGPKVHSFKDIFQEIGFIVRE